MTAGAVTPGTEATSRPVARRQGRPGWRPRWPIGLIIPVVLVAAWQLAKSAGALPYANLPSPLQIWDSAVSLTGNGQIPGDFGHTLAACLLGWVIGSAIGTAVGVALGLSRLVWSYSMASVEVLRSILDQCDRARMDEISRVGAFAGEEQRFARPQAPFLT